LGYNSIAFFAPEPRYLRTPFANEFKTMVNQFHAHGIEIILDVVYNHTAEGNELGPTLSFKGIDNASYYRLLPDQKRYYINDTGTGGEGTPYRSRRARTQARGFPPGTGILLTLTGVEIDVLPAASHQGSTRPLEDHDLPGRLAS
jgi:hypothetical protein